MYSNEKLINGIWHYKTSPRMEWKPMSLVQLTNKIAAQERELNKLRLPSVMNCLSCGKNHAELCGSCVSDIAQGTAEQAISSR